MPDRRMLIQHESSRQFSLANTRGERLRVHLARPLVQTRGRCIEGGQDPWGNLQKHLAGCVCNADKASAFISDHATATRGPSQGIEAVKQIARENAGWVALSEQRTAASAGHAALY